MPLLAEVDGLALVAHPKGPAVATSDVLMTLARFAADINMTERIRDRVVKAYIDLTWPTLKATLESEAS